MPPQHINSLHERARGTGVGEGTNEGPGEGRPQNAQPRRKRAIPFLPENNATTRWLWVGREEKWQTCISQCAGTRVLGGCGVGEG